MIFLEKLLDLIFPPGLTCMVCGRSTDLKGICLACRRKMTDRSGLSICRVCGRYMLMGGELNTICNECMQSAPVFFVARSLGPYRGELKEAVYLFKYQGLYEMSDCFGHMLAGLIMDQSYFAGAGMLVPVPISKQKAKLRGYNQSELLAEKAGKILGLPVNRCLSRVKDTPSQSRLTGTARRDMVQGVFALSGSPCRGSIILVDDILTTGATAGECARLLLSAGADSVGVVTIAAGIQEKSGRRC